MGLNERGQEIQVADAEGKTTRAYREIERMIVFQDIPAGSLVSEAAMMDRTGLGRTPVREALQRLARNRMVEIHPNKGVLVPPISVDAQLKRLELRRVLEVLAVRLACERAREDQRTATRQLLEDLKRGGYTLREYADTIQRTHELIASGASNAYLADALAPLQGLSRRFWIAHVVDEEAEIEAGSRLHVTTLEALLARDAEAAEHASHALNDYLVSFAYAALGSPPHPRDGGLAPGGVAASGGRG
jgi:DNA-binding GntR family transcriptional regulator